MQSPMYVYHICPKKTCNMVYRGLYRNDIQCPLCQTMRYKGEGKKRRPAKIFYYMSIKGYVQYLCSNEEFVR